MTTEQKVTQPKPDKMYVVTGTYHGSIVIAPSEGQARRMFHQAYNGESITHLKEKKGGLLP